MIDETAALGPLPFRLGVNYWPARTGMRWWTEFDVAELAADFELIKAYGFDSLRIFLTWEAFQPSALHIDGTMIARLVSTLNAARHAGLSVIPTLFMGHMSGVNWIPPWALGNAAGDDRFRVVSEGRVTGSRLANWFSDDSILRAQYALAFALAGALSGHEALWAWDLGNENSNCVVPANKREGREWLLRMTEAVRGADPDARVTVGLHMEDLSEDRNLGPREAAECCDFLTMHGYPGYASWADGPTDERALPFLSRLTRHLSGGTDVLFAEFGVPTPTRAGAKRAQTSAAPSHVLVDEVAAANYVDRALDALQGSGSLGAMLWCYSDYAKSIWALPPLDLAVHERSFGLWRADGSPKPALARIEAFKALAPDRREDPRTVDAAWIDVDVDEFYRAPEFQLPRLYARYCAALADVQ